MLNLTPARGYLRKLFDNAKVAHFCSAHHLDILAEFETIAPRRCCGELHRRRASFP